MPESNIIGHILGKQKRLLLNRPSNEWILADTMLGLEIEVEGVSAHLLPDPHDHPAKRQLPAEVGLYWKIHRDESLHNYGGEFSYVTPMFGEDVSQSLRAFLAFAQKEGSFQATLRTGIHVHMDARDLSRFQLLGLLVYYVVFEPAIYTWIGDNRDCNNFCVPWYRAEGALQQAIQILVSFRDYYNDINKQNENALAYCEQFHRYAGLNLQALYKFGSIEFRQLKTCFDLNRISSWINILLSLKHAAQMVPESSMTIIAEIKRRGLKASAMEIFGEPFVKQVWSRDPHIEDKIRELALPSAIELIGQVNYVIDQHATEALTWFPDREAARQGRKPHPWFTKWRRMHFPKDLRLPQEEKPEYHKSRKFRKLWGDPTGYYFDEPAPITIAAGQAQQGQVAYNQMVSEMVGNVGLANVAPDAQPVPQIAPPGAVALGHLVPANRFFLWGMILQTLDAGDRPEIIYEAQVPGIWAAHLPSWGYYYQLVTDSEYGYLYRPYLVEDWYLNHPRNPNQIGQGQAPVQAPAFNLNPGAAAGPFDNNLEEILNEMNDEIGEF